MTVNDNKNLQQELLEETWNKGNLDNLDKYLDDGYVEHRPDGEIQGIDEYRKLVTVFRKAYPDLHVELKNVVADENLVAGTYVFTGTMKGDFGPIEATGENVKVEGAFVSRIENGKFVEHWNRFDQLTAMAQLGVLSIPEYLQMPLIEQLEAGEQERGMPQQPQA